jgi:transposase-like protein
MTEPDYDDPFLEIRYAIRRNYAEARRIRLLVLEQLESGHSQREIGRRVGVTHSTLAHWVKLAREERDEPSTPSIGDRMPYGKG